MSMRSIMMGLQTVLGLRRRGFFIPYRYADTLPAGGDVATYQPILEDLKGCEESFARIIQSIDIYADDLLAIGDEAAPQPRWQQDWFPRLDAATAYALVRETKPRRIVETGSGHSTRFMARAVRDGNGTTAITAIDPAPRAAIDNLGVEVIRKTVAQAGVGPFADLAAGDIIFIDSSHIMMPGSDVDDLLNRILPTLPAGVLVHIHDIFLPDDYPSAWAWRGYNEQSAVLPLLSGGGYEIVFSSYYAVSRMGDKVQASVLGKLPLPEGAYETSLWLRKIK